MTSPFVSAAPAFVSEASAQKALVGVDTILGFYSFWLGVGGNEVDA